MEEKERQRQFEKFFMEYFPKVKAFLAPSSNRKPMPRMWRRTCLSSCGASLRFSICKRHGVPTSTPWCATRFSTCLSIATSSWPMRSSSRRSQTTWRLMPSISSMPRRYSCSTSWRWSKCRNAGAKSSS